MDALRALAIAGVILGHWLVTALVLSPSGSGTKLHDMSPLQAMPWLAPMSWLFQTLAIFFLVGGYSAAISYKGNYLAWLRKRMTRLTRPVAVLAAVWVPLTAAMLLAGMPGGTVHTVVTLVLDPLWFLCVFAGLTALTPPAVALVRRFGAWAAVAARRPGGRGGRGPVPPRRPGLAGLAERRRRLAGALPARHRLGPRLVPRLEGARRAAGGRDGRHRGADHLGRLPGQHGRGERRSTSPT